MGINFRKIISFSAALLVLFSFYAPDFCRDNVLRCHADAPDIALSEFGYIVYDMELGQTLMSNMEDSQFEYPALVTMLIGSFALQKLQPTGKIVAESTTVSKDESLLLEKDQAYTIQSLINACVVENAENAASLLAKKMEIDDPASFLNEFAEENNFSDTYFVTDSAFTTAADLAKITKKLLGNADFKSLFFSTYVSGPNGEIITNANGIVFENTQDSLGGNFSSGVATFVKMNDDLALITIVTGVNEKNYLEVEKFLENTAENNFSKKILVKKDDVVTSVKLEENSTREVSYIVKDTVSVYMPNDGTSIISAVTFSYNEGFSEGTLTLPIDKGTLAGTVTYTLTDGTAITLPIYTMTDVHFASSLIDNVRMSIINYKDIYIFVCVLLILLIFIIAYKIWMSRV